MIYDLYKAMFYLEDIREILRKNVPFGISNEKDEKEFNDLLNKTVQTLEGLSHEPACDRGNTIKYISDRIEIRTREEEFLNIDPIQAGGRLTPEARKVLISYGDGYSVCDNCFKPFRLDYIKKPPVQEFVSELSEFLNMDDVRVVRGARNGFQIVANALLNKNDVALISSLSHYTLALSIESMGAIWKEIPAGKNNIVTAEETAKKIETVKEETGRLPRLVAIDHIDYNYGNEHDVYGISKVCRDYDIPFLYNGAYTVGIMPVDGKKIGADFIVGSGHKSMASPAPTGVLATTDDFKDVVFGTTKLKGDVTGRKFGIKEPYLLGCTVMGAPLVAMIASFPMVKERVKDWDDEVKKSNFFISEFLKIKGDKVSSELPRRHTLTKVDTSESFDRIAQKHKRRGFFLYDELNARKITGLFPGASRGFKLNTYGLNWDQIKYLADSFRDIAERYGLDVE